MVAVIYFHHKHSLFASVGQAGGQTLLHVQLWYLFSSYKLPKTVAVTTLLLFGPVTLLCATFLCI